MIFKPEDHHLHDMYGNQTIHYAGTLIVKDNEWWMGNNMSDDMGSTTQVEGCYTCDVEFNEEESS